MLSHITMTKFFQKISESRYYSLLFSIFTFILCYGVPNHLVQERAQYIPLSIVDRAIPLIPWTIFFYISSIVWTYLPLFFLRPRERYSFLIQFFLMSLFSCIIFFLFPIKFPIEYWPIEQELSNKTVYSDIMYWFITCIRWADNPVNCFPSLHIAYAFLSFKSFLGLGLSSKKSLKLKIPFQILISFITLGITVSTLTIKQHYFVDIVAGILLFFLVSWISKRLITSDSKTQ